MEKPVSKAEFIDWRDHPITQEIFKVLQEEVETGQMDMRRAIFSGNYNQAAVYEGVIRGLEQLLKIDYEEFSNES